LIYKPQRITQAPRNTKKQALEDGRQKRQQTDLAADVPSSLEALAMMMSAPRRRREVSEHVGMDA
jgi:hypothetical protein